MKIRLVLLVSSVIIMFRTCSGDEVSEEFEYTTEYEGFELNDTTTIGPTPIDYSEEDVTYPGYFDTVTSTVSTTITSSSTTTTTTEEPELRYLEFEYEFLDRETFWKMNPFECINGTLRPSPYLRRKYHECELIHHGYNPQCTMNCQMAITMLLESQIPNLDLFKRFFEIVLPDYLKEAAVSHYSECFAKFGNVDDFLDYSCIRPQPFFECMSRFQTQMVCSEEESLLPTVEN